MRLALLAMLLSTACGATGRGAAEDSALSAPEVDLGEPDAPEGRDSAEGDAAPTDATSAPASVRAKARALALALSGRAEFLIGLGNDLDGAPTYDPDRSAAFTLGPAVDLHYVYLVGYGDRGGWTTWNADASFPTLHADAARRHGAVPMFTIYALALDYENGADPLADPERMARWLGDLRLLFARLGAFDAPAVVHVEPDLYGFLQQRLRASGAAPADYPLSLRHPDLPECAHLPERLASLGACLAALRDALAPKARLGLHASQWGHWYDPRDPDADVVGAARAHAAFLAAVGAGALDLIVVETLDRDAGFWEAFGGASDRCSPTDGPRGAVYWDETNTAVPHFHQHLAWVGALTEALALPALWWQTPLGVPTETCGGSDGAWRDNRVRYFFGHVGELVAAGGLGAAFGTGAGGQTDVTRDGGQFRRALEAYRAAPRPL